MQDIAELERRITAALERIAKGVEGRQAAPEVSDAPDHSAELTRLTDALDEERMANAQLQERLRVVREKETKQRGTLEEQIAQLMAQVDAQGLELSRAHQVIVQQGGQLRDLREAAEAGPIDASLINQTMHIELDALRATRSIEVAELDDILAALDPLIAEEGGPDART
ncbi:MAG: hypothetical protein ACRC14_15000 [Paracoccaceae bacterium]